MCILCGLLAPQIHLIPSLLQEANLCAWQQQPSSPVVQLQAALSQWEAPAGAGKVGRGAY